MILLNLYGQDVSTDGKWCYIVFWVIGDSQTRWGLLKKRLMGACPSCSSASVVLYYRAEMQAPKPSDVFLLKLSCHDRKGLLYGTFFFYLLSIFCFWFYICAHVTLFVYLVSFFHIKHSYFEMNLGFGLLIYNFCGLFVLSFKLLIHTLWLLWIKRKERENVESLNDPFQSTCFLMDSGISDAFLLLWLEWQKLHSSAFLVFGYGISDFPLQWRILIW